MNVYPLGYWLWTKMALHFLSLDTAPQGRILTHLEYLWFSTEGLDGIYGFWNVEPHITSTPWLCASLVGRSESTDQKGQYPNRSELFLERDLNYRLWEFDTIVYFILFNKNIKVIRNKYYLHLLRKRYSKVLTIFLNHCWNVNYLLLYW